MISTFGKSPNQIKGDPRHNQKYQIDLCMSKTITSVWTTFKSSLTREKFLGLTLNPFGKSYLALLQFGLPLSLHISHMLPACSRRSLYNRPYNLSPERAHNSQSHYCWKCEMCKGSGFSPGLIPTIQVLSWTQAILIIPET